MNNNYFKLEPDVAGGIGEQTALDAAVHPPIVHTLHYEFAGWPEDPILATFPCFIVTEEARQALVGLGATGMSFDHAIITTSPEFDELYPGRELPEFVWLKVHGIPMRDDFGLLPVPGWRLVVSERVMNVFLGLGLSYGIVTSVEAE